MCVCTSLLGAQTIQQSSRVWERSAQWLELGAGALKLCVGQEEKKNSGRKGGAHHTQWWSAVNKYAMDAMELRTRCLWRQPYLTYQCSKKTQCEHAKDDMKMTFLDVCMLKCVSTKAWNTVSFITNFGPECRTSRKLELRYQCSMSVDLGRKPCYWCMWFWCNACPECIKYCIIA